MAGESALFRHHPPPLLACLLKKTITRGVSGSFGDFLFQEIQTPEAVVWYNNYLLLKNLDKHITLLILSRKVGLNKHKLKNAFQQLYGSTVTSYRLHARMKEATLLLNTTDESIEGIGFTTGYANAQHFSKAYKKYYGHTPAGVRRDKAL